jgi:hypothetical protein
LAVKKLSGFWSRRGASSYTNAHDEGETETEYEYIEQGIRHSSDEIMDGNRCCEEIQLLLDRRDVRKRPRERKNAVKNEQQRAQAEKAVRGKREKIHIVRLIVF